MELRQLPHFVAVAETLNFADVSIVIWKASNPSPLVRTFIDLVRQPAYNMKQTDRAEILKMLEASFDDGTAVLQSFSDQDLPHPPSHRGPTGSWAARTGSASSTL